MLPAMIRASRLRSGGSQEYRPSRRVKETYAVKGRLRYNRDAAGKPGGIKNTLVAWHSSRFAVFAESILIGLIAGFTVVFFRILLEHTADLRTDLYSLLKEGTILHILVWIVCLIPLGIFLGWMNKRWPMINGSGIPQVRGAIILKMTLSWWLELPMKLLSAVIAIGSGR